MKSFFMALLALLSFESIAAKNCNLVTTLDLDRELVIFRFTTEEASDLVHIMPLNTNCATVMTDLISKFPRTHRFDGVEYATVLIYKYDSEEPLSGLFTLTAFQQRYEVIDSKDKPGIKQVIPEEFADRIR